jgi:hypothetical protein
MSVSSAAASNLVAGLFGFDAREFFELRDQAVALPPAV